MARYTGNHCPVCEQAFTDEDDIVVCPDCGTPYHRACWQKVGVCMHQSEHAAGFEWKPEFGPEAESAAAEAVCPNCGTHNQPGAARCSHCGVPLPRAGQEPGAAPKQEEGPIYARRPGAGGYAPPQNPGPASGPNNSRSAPGPHIDAYSTGADGGVYRREVGPEDPIDGIKARDWATFVGRSPMYYLMQFFRMSETRRRVAFSFSAFFFGPAYLLYRKMWKEGILVGVVTILLAIPGLMATVATYNPGFFGSLPLGWLLPAITVCDILSAVVRVLLALFALSLYEKHAKNRIQAVYAQVADQAQRTDALARSGGTNILAAVLYFAVLLLVEMAFFNMAGPAFFNTLLLNF